MGGGPIGVELGSRWTAVEAAGLYVPGGTASYPSSVLMNAIPAKVAGVERVVPILRPFKLASRDFKKQNTVIELHVKNKIIKVGNNAIAMMAGPCAVESREQIMAAAYQLNIQVSDRTIDSHVRNLRGKFPGVDLVETRAGIGYRIGRCA